MNTHAAVGATRAGALSHKTTGSSAAAGTMASAGAAAGGNLFASLLSDAAEVAEPDIHEAAGKGTGKARKGLSTEVLPEGRGVDPLSVPMPGVLPVPEGGAQVLTQEVSARVSGQGSLVARTVRDGMEAGGVRVEGSATPWVQGQTPGTGAAEAGVEAPSLAGDEAESGTGFSGAQVVMESSRAPSEGGPEGGTRGAVPGMKPLVPVAQAPGAAESTVARWAGTPDAAPLQARAATGGVRPETRGRPLGVNDLRSEGRGLGGALPESITNEIGLGASSWVLAVQGSESISGVLSKPAELRQEVVLQRPSDDSQAGVITGPEVAVPTDAGVSTAAIPLDDLANQVAYLSSQGVQSAQLTVETEGGERVEVRVDLAGNEAQVSFRSDVPETRAALERASDQLQGMLAKEGLVLSGMSIGAQTPQQQSGGQTSSQAWAERRGTAAERSGPKGFEPVAAPVRSSHQGAVDIFV